MSGVTNDRWSCPVCGEVLVLSGSPAAIRNCIHHEQIRHGRAHAAAEQMPMPEQRRKPA